MHAEFPMLGPSLRAISAATEEKKRVYGLGSYSRPQKPFSIGMQKKGRRQSNLGPTSKFWVCLLNSGMSERVFLLCIRKNERKTQGGTSSRSAARESSSW